MAADRRVTRGGHVEEDDRTKTLILGGRMIFGFTGMAELGRQRQHTMRWLAGEFARYGDNVDLNQVAQALEPVINSTPGNPKDKRLTIMGVGYQEGRIVYVLMSNVHSDQGYLLTSTRRTFWLSIVYPEVRSTIRAVGQPMPIKVWKDLQFRLRTTHGDRLPSQRTVSDLLAGAMQGSAGKYVSNTALITVLSASGEASFDVVTPRSRPGQMVDIASPYMVSLGGVMVLPPQRMRRALRRPVQ